MADVVVITGASSGIGRATAHRFARTGRPLALIARGAEALEATRREIEALGIQALAIPLDMADDEAVEAATRRIEVELGPIGIWVNNAMVNVWGEFLDIPEAEFRRVTEIGYFGYVNGTRAALRRMKPRDQGSIIQVGSMISYVAAPLQSAYSGVKHAVRGFTEAVRAELMHAGSRVRIGMVLPASINTPFYDTAGNRMRGGVPRPVPPVYQPELVAEAIRHMAERGGREMFVGGVAEAAAVARALAPALTNQVLPLTYSAQCSAGAEAETGSGNLFQPVPGDRGIHGRFGAEALRISPHLWLAEARSTAEAFVTGVTRRVFGRH
ncbi:MAG TPA: SDR family oxidoreductase [Acetobacteraceae bacterium]|nr:SDR family oxidoreductase [Acetobacteraceae bacterium]